MGTKDKQDKDPVLLSKTIQSRMCLKDQHVVISQKPDKDLLTAREANGLEEKQRRNASPGSFFSLDRFLRFLVL